MVNLVELLRFELALKFGFLSVAFVQFLAYTVTVGCTCLALFIFPLSMPKLLAQQITHILYMFIYLSTTSCSEHFYNISQMMWLKRVLFILFYLLSLSSHVQPYSSGAASGGHPGGADQTISGYEQWGLPVHISKCLKIYVWVSVCMCVSILAAGLPVQV